MAFELYSQVCETKVPYLADDVEWNWLTLTPRASTPSRCENTSGPSHAARLPRVSVFLRFHLSPETHMPIPLAPPIFT